MEVIMAEFPMMPIYVANLLADTNHMTTEEFGAYCLILFTMWQQGGRLLERDLLKISNLSAYKFSKSREKICRPLTIIEGTVSQKRLEDTRLKVLDKRAKAQASVSRRRDRQPGYDRATDVQRTNLKTLRNAYETPTIQIRKKEEELTPTTLPRAREPAVPQKPHVETSPAPPEDPMTVPLTEIARRMSERQSGAPVPQTEDPMKIPLSEIARRMSEEQTQQARKEAAADGSTALESISQMQASEIAELAAAKREADEALAEAKRRKLTRGAGFWGESDCREISPCRAGKFVVSNYSPHHTDPAG
jgi:uncharacterized protein YdaU (DUF1376 family)